MFDYLALFQEYLTVELGLAKIHRWRICVICAC